MAQASKASSRARPRLRAEQAGAKRQTTPGEPFLRFYHSAGLRKKTLGVLERLETSPDPTEHRAALADIVVDLTRCGMDTFFMKPLLLAKAGFITEQSAGIGMAGAIQVLSSVIRNIVGSMGAPQLLSVCGSIRQFMK